MKDSLIDKLKYETGKSTTEELFDIIPQEENQCPHINTMQTMVEWGLRHLKDGYDSSDQSEEALHSSMKDCELEIEQITNELEIMRESIINIRAWGEEWKNLAKWLLEQLPEDSVRELVGLEAL